MICLAMCSALLIGIAKPTFCVESPKLPVAAAVFMPITLPEMLASGPPESPCTMPALVCSMPCSVSLVAAPLSLAVIVLFMPVILPTTAGNRPAP